VQLPAVKNYLARATHSSSCIVFLYTRERTLLAASIYQSEFCAAALEWTGRFSRDRNASIPSLLRCNIKLLRLTLESVCASLQFALIRGDKINFQRQARRQQEMIRFLCLSLSPFRNAAARASLIEMRP
jgi:hypothetical protein